MTAAIRVGNPLSPDTEMGPLITPAHREKVRAWIAIGDAEGARRVTGRRVKKTLPAGHPGRLSPGMHREG